MITVIGNVQATVRIDMTMPGRPEPESAAPEISPWEKEAYGEGGRFGSMTAIPSGDPMKDRITVFFSGCAYNTAKALAGDGLEVRFLSVVGEDPLGLAAIADLERSGVKTEDMVLIDALSREENEEDSSSEDSPSGVKPVAAESIPGGLKGSLTSVKVVAKNFLGDTEFWRVDERIQKELSPARLEAKAELLESADMVFIDGSLPEETILRAGELCREYGTELYFDPADLEGGSRSAGALEYFAGIMPGRREAEAMSGLQILSPDQLTEACRFFREKGIRRVVITMKGGGLYYCGDGEEGVLRPERVLQFGETGGAGDVVTGVLLTAFAKEETMKAAAEKAMAGAAEYLAEVSDERRY